MHAVRWTFITAVLALGLATATWFAGPASAQVAVSDSALLARSIGFEIRPRIPCAPESLEVTAWVYCSTWCAGVTSFEPTSAFSARLRVNGVPPALCDRHGCDVQRRTIRLAPPLAGSMDYSFTVVVSMPPDSLHPTGELAFTRRIPVVATVTCTSPPDSATRGVTREIVIAGATPPCAGCPPVVCAGRRLPVTLRGALAGGCERFDGLRRGTLPSPTPGGAPLPVFEIATRIVSPICLASLEPFSVTDTLPAADPGLRTFFVHETHFNEVTGEVTTSGPIPQRFVAKDSCDTLPPVAGCVWPYLLPKPLTPTDSTDCHLKLMPGTRGIVPFAVRSSEIPLAGLQGVISASAGLRLLNLYTWGQPMHFTTHRTDFGGIAFALYADKGAPIRAGDDVRVIVAEVAADTALAGGERLWVAGAVTAASDSLAHEIPICPIQTFAPVVANVCIGSPSTCDANHDGRVNVADLVALARCWYHPESCGDSIGHPDCTANGSYDFGDVVCCARVALGEGHEGTPRRAERLSIQFGSAMLSYGCLAVPLTIRGATEMNGALLRVRYPSDRYEAVIPAHVDQPSFAATDGGVWMWNIDPTSEDVIVATLRTGDGVPDEVTVPLYFVLRDGATPGGTLTIDSGDLMTPDGGRLDVDLASVIGTLPEVLPTPPTAIEHVELLARPNPSPGATRFTLRLPRAGQVDLSVFDLAGRRVATVWRGAMAAGEREVTWQPSGLRRGVYFAKLSIDGAVAVNRVVLQPQR